MNQINKLIEGYNNKKSNIKERLNQFKKFFNEPYSWFYRNGELVLLPVETNDDYRLFEELCFCIFTANTSAEMSLKAIDAVRTILINGTAEDMTRRLEEVGYIYNRKRPEYVVHTRNYLKNSLNFELKKKIKSFKGKDELRDFFALNKDVKGLGYKEASHFLRNIGFRGYAILDKHIINSMHDFGALEKPEPPKPKNYLEIEQKFIDFSKDIEIDMDELDLLLWSRKNGRILK